MIVSMMQGIVDFPRPEGVLGNLRTLATHDTAEALTTIGGLFCEHSLSVLRGGGELNMRLRSLHQGGVGMDLLDYGTAVRIDPGPLSTFVLVQIPLSGHADLTVAGTTWQSDQTTASIPPVDQPSSMRWHEDTPQLIVYLERAPLERVARSLFGIDQNTHLGLPATLDLTSEAGKAFSSFVSSFHTDLNSGSPAVTNAVARTILHETLMARFLLALDAPPAGTPTRQSLHPAPSKVVARFRELLDRHAHEAVGVVDLAEAMQIPLRTLQHCVRHELGTTPSQMLVRARLNLAHSRLRAADPTTATVTTIALDCGFNHLGRFAAEYRAAFGESPSESLRR